MKPDARRYLAFRFFGIFQWPPVKRKYGSTADETDSTVRESGVVDIIYAENDDRTKLLAFLRWAPREDFEGKTSWKPVAEDLSKVVRIQTLDDSELSNLFADHTKTVLLRLDPPRQSRRDVLTWDRRLLFRGGLILDQYKINDENDAAKNDLPPVDRRLLLSRKFAKGGFRYYSDLIIGQPDNHGKKNAAYRFDLALPTITPQFTTGNAETDAFPFSAIYTPELAKQALTNDLIGIDTLLVGRGNLSTIISSVPNDALLGRFGFSRGAGNGCVETSSRLWAINGPLVAEHVLRPIGFSTAGILSIPSGPGANKFSIRFEEKGGLKTRIFHRLSIAAGGSGTWTNGDVARISGRLHFKVPSLLNQWLDVGADAIPIEIEHSYQIADDEIWSVVSGGRPGLHVMTARLGLTGTFASTWDPPAADRLDAADLLQNAIRGMRLAILGLDSNQSTAPDATLADFDIPQQSALFALTAEFNPKRSKNGNLDWKIEPGMKPDYRLTMWHDTLRTDGDPPYQLLASAWLPLLTGRKGGAGQPDLFVSISDDVKHADNRKCQFRLLPITVGNPQPMNGMLGGMSVQNNSATVHKDLGSDDQSHFWFSPREPSSIRIPVGTNFNSFQLPSIFLRLRLDLSRATPVALATPWGDRANATRPLLITSPRDGAEKSRFLLDCRETISGNDDRWLQVDLIDQTENTIEADEYVVLSQEPFGLVRFRSQALEARGSQDNAVVASYDSDTRQWQLKRTVTSYHYEFPPQASGESMDKPRRLEIHDPEPPINGVLAPALSDLERRAVEFRLTPSAEIWIRPNDEERGYVLPQWETKEIFRRNGALGVGVGLEALRAEFLYGLSVGVKPGDELGPSRRARIAELEALVGRLPTRQTIARLDDAITQRWGSLQETLSRRPERLEIWANDPDSDVAFAPARFQRGAQFSLRSTALHRPPIIDGEITNEPETGKLRFDSQHGLSGGALWPLESKNFFNALVANPASTRGSIERVALSPTGGDADQKAEFLENRLAIISETRNGFVQRHKIEIIGRIGVYWHRAKHVVVYERTVNPTAQFTPAGGIKTRTRRPVLRKVSEYIELIEPVRNYPDFPAELESSGFLRSVRFNQKTINVDSEWSEDTGTFGWKIPLWNRHSAAERPRVYPRPDIGFVTNAEGDGDNPTTTQECLDPENLYFFADATIGAGDNTDNWSSRAGIDYSLLPFPSDAVQRESTIEGEEDARAPSARRIPRGYRRFTWRLGPVSARTTVNAGRSDKPLYVGLQSITFMRPRPPQDPHTLEQISEHLRDSSQLLRANEAAELTHWRKPGGAPTELQELDQALVEFLDAVHTGGDITGSANVLVGELVKTKDDLTNDSRLAGCIVQAKTYWDTVSKLKSQDVVSRCEKLADDFVGSLRRKQLLILEEIRSWEAYDLPQFVAVGTTVDDIVAEISGKIVQVLTPVLTEAVRDVAGAGNSIAAARQVARDLESEIEEILERAKRELNSIKTTYDFNKPWSAQRLAEFQQRVRNVQQGIIGDLESAVFEIQHRLGVELDQVAQQIAADATFAASQIQSSITGELSGAETAARAYLQSLKRAIERAEIHKRAAEIKAKLDQAIAQDGSYTALFQTIRGRVDSFDQSIRDIEQLGEKPGDALLPGAATLQNWIAQAVARSNELVTRAAQWTDQSIADLLQVTNPALATICAEIETAIRGAFVLPTNLASYANDFGKIADELLASGLSQVDNALTGLKQDIEGMFADIDRAGAWVEQKLEAIAEQTGPDNALTIIEAYVVRPAVREALQGIADPFVLNDAFQSALHRRLRDVSALAEKCFSVLDKSAMQGLGAITEACRAVGGSLDSALHFLEDAKGVLEGQIEDLKKKFSDAAGDITKLTELARTIDVDIRKIGNDLADSYSGAQSYVDRVSEAIGHFSDGDVGALPGKVLRLYAAAATAPAMPNLDFARERLGYYYQELNKVIDTSKAEAWFGKLGDELKALGLNLPFNKIGDGLIPFDLSQYDIGRIFRNFGGLKLDALFKGYRLPDGVTDAIKVTHDFDKKQFRAWVQIDVNAPIKGRKSLFTIGPFQLDFVDTDFIAKVRLDASKDSDKVEQTGSATLLTDIEAVVGGQTMVTMRRVAIRYDKSSGLKVDLDPKGIKLNPTFQFIQDTLGSLFPSELGGMKVIKQNGVPVGVEHEFSMPPVSLMYATSGVNNISISNNFSLVAFPDFVISDRFSLSKPEMPFLFSLFILGGTGYVTVDTTYRPFRDELMVVVEAAAGASASLGFAFGPISGQVFVTLSAALSYRKLIGNSGGGLTVSLVLLVAGNVDVAGIATVYLGLLLRLNYRDTGQIDAAGTATVSVRISRFFTLSARANAKYTLRGAKAQTVTSVDTSAKIDPNDPTIKSATEKAKKLMEARP